MTVKPQSRKRRGWLIFFYTLLVLGGWFGGQWLTSISALDIRPSNEPQIHAMILSVTAIYILAAALPFVPGAEIGFALLIALGSSIVVLVYVSMVAALLLSFLIGSLVPARLIAYFFGWLGLHKAHDLVLQLLPLDTAARLDFLTSKAPRQWLPMLLRHRYLTLAVLINTPGNSLLGGGGGISLIAGMSGLFRLPAYALTIALAVSPLPLLILLTGYQPF